MNRKNHQTLNASLFISENAEENVEATEGATAAEGTEDAAKEGGEEAAVEEQNPDEAAPAAEGTEVSVNPWHMHENIFSMIGPLGALFRLFRTW